MAFPNQSRFEPASSPAKTPMQNKVTWLSAELLRTTSGRAGFPRAAITFSLRARFDGRC